MKILIALSLALALSSCASFGQYAGNLGRALVGVGAVSEAPAVRASLVDYLDAASEAKAAESLAFLDQVYTTVVDLDSDTSVVDLVLSAPETWSHIPVAYNEIKAVVSAYAEQSGEPIPAPLIAFDKGILPAYGDLNAAVNASERVRKIAEVVRLLKPLAVVLL